MIKPIRTPSELHRAKAHLAELIKNNMSDHDDEIEVLSILVEQYERATTPIDAPSPIAAIKFRMNEMGLSPRQLEPFIGSRARVSEVLSGKRQLSIDMIRSLHEGLSIPYRSLITKRSSSNRIERVAAVTKRGVTPHVLDARDSTHITALHRKTLTQRAASKMDQTALFVWQAAVLRESESSPAAVSFEQSTFGPEKLRAVARLSARPDGPLRAVRYLSACGIATVILPPLRGTFLDGVAMLGAAGAPVIGLTLRHDRIDSFWFTLLHELAHITLHYDYLSQGGAAFVDDIDIESDDVYEREADQLARESLIPRAFMLQINWDERTSQDEIVALAIRARIHVAIAAGRWQRDYQNYKKFARLIERGTVRDMFDIDYARA